MSQRTTKDKDDTAKVSCSILGEQRQLVIAEHEIISMLEKVNGELNQLLVEELQLKSNDIAMLSETKRPFYPKIEPNTSNFDYDSAKDVNQQNLNLSENDFLTMEFLEKRNVGGGRSDEEEEEEDGY